jgi:hypothetical protein
MQYLYTTMLRGTVYDAQGGVNPWYVEACGDSVDSKQCIADLERQDADDMKHMASAAATRSTRLTQSAPPAMPPFLPRSSPSLTIPPFRLPPARSPPAPPAARPFEEPSRAEPRRDEPRRDEPRTEIIRIEPVIKQASTSIPMDTLNELILKNQLLSNSIQRSKISKEIESRVNEKVDAITEACSVTLCSS